MKNTIKVLSVLIVIIMLTMAVLPNINAAGVVLREIEDLPYEHENIGGAENKKWGKDFLEITDFDWCYPMGSDEPYYYYEPLYEYYGDNTLGSTPDYVLIYAFYPHTTPVHVFGYYGDYILHSGNAHSPYLIPYCVYLPNNREVFGLREAYDLGIEGIENVFTDYGIGTLVGDINGDGKLNVKDATYIQKCVADIIKFPMQDSQGLTNDVDPMLDCSEAYISDFNRDGERNIKDATAIQKYIAGL